MAGEIRDLPADARLTGRALSQALDEQATLAGAEPPDGEQAQAAAAHLDVLRGTVRKHARQWRLQALKTTLRGYRELTLAAYQD